MLGVQNEPCALVVLAFSPRDVVEFRMSYKDEHGLTIVQRGRKTRYSPAFMEKICTALEDGCSLRKAAAEAGVDSASVRRWCKADERVAMQYALARDAGIRGMEERLLELYEQAHEAAKNQATGVQRLQAIKYEIDGIKWLLCKRYPREYGDSVGGVLATDDGSAPREPWMNEADKQAHRSHDAFKAELAAIRERARAIGIRC